VTITGQVSNLQAVVSVIIHLPHQPHLALDFVVDTGFTGYLMLPLPAVSALSLPFLEDIRANLAVDFVDGGSVTIGPVKQLPS
jgi:predicted aspartyl protease